MKSDFNFTIIEGNLISDPLWYGKEKLIMEIKSKNNKGKEQIFSAFTNPGNLANNIEKYLKKGNRVLISGKLEKIKERIFIETKDVNFLSPANKGN